MKLLENRFFDKEINGNKAVEHTAKREKTKPKSVVLARRNVFGLDRGAGGETLGPEGRRSMMSLPNRVFICLLRIYSREHIWQRVLDNHGFTHIHSLVAFCLVGLGTSRLTQKSRQKCKKREKRQFLALPWLQEHRLDSSHPDIEHWHYAPGIVMSGPERSLQEHPSSNPIIQPDLYLYPVRSPTGFSPNHVLLSCPRSRPHLGDAQRVQFSCRGRGMQNQPRSIWP